jgi:hypothetical protein
VTLLLRLASFRRGRGIISRPVGNPSVAALVAVAALAMAAVHPIVHHAAWAPLSHGAGPPPGLPAKKVHSEKSLITIIVF